MFNDEIEKITHMMKEKVCLLMLWRKMSILMVAFTIIKEYICCGYELRKCMRFQQCGIFTVDSDEPLQPPFKL